MATRDIDAGSTATAGSDGGRALRLALKADAVASGGLGALALAAGGLLDGPLGLTRGFLVAVGVFLLAYAAFLVVIATRSRVIAPAVWLVIVGNAAWVIASVVFTFVDWYPLTTLGVVVVLAQALVVAVLAEMQVIGLRKAS